MAIAETGLKPTQNFWNICNIMAVVPTLVETGSRGGVGVRDALEMEHSAICQLSYDWRVRLLENPRKVRVLLFIKLIHILF